MLDGFVKEGGLELELGNGNMVDIAQHGKGVWR